jgi:hypothetical protein
MTPEGVIQTYLKSEVLRHGGRFRKLKWIGRKGAPDCFIWWEGPILALVEVKTEVGKLSPHQVYEIDRLRQDGFRVYVVHSKLEVDAFISELTAISRKG